MRALIVLIVALLMALVVSVVKLRAARCELKEVRKNQSNTPPPASTQAGTETPGPVSKQAATQPDKEAELSGALYLYRAALGEALNERDGALKKITALESQVKGLEADLSTKRDQVPRSDRSARPVSEGDPLDKQVSLVAPYHRLYPGSNKDRMSVQYAVIAVLRQTGLRYDWQTSYANTNPICRQWVRPDIRNKSCREALEMILGPVGLTYKIVDGKVVLRRR